MAADELKKRIYELCARTRLEREKTDEEAEEESKGRRNGCPIPHEDRVRGGIKSGKQRTDRAIEYYAEPIKDIIRPMRDNNISCARVAKKLRHSNKTDVFWFSQCC